jgi:hypothetical protein
MWYNTLSTKVINIKESNSFSYVHSGTKDTYTQIIKQKSCAELLKT